MAREALEQQADTFSRYLLGKPAPAAARELYARAMADATMPKREQRLFAFALRHPWTLGYIDGGLVFVSPHAETRRRLYVMLSILETMPELADDFLPKKRSKWYVAYLAVVGLRGCLRALVGVVMAKALGV